MASTDTLPLPRLAPSPEAHEHAWLVESRHATSDGTVLYVRCTECPARRVDLVDRPQSPPAALSRTVLTPSER